MVATKPTDLCASNALVRHSLYAATVVKMGIEDGGRSARAEDDMARATSVDRPIDRRKEASRSMQTTDGGIGGCREGLR